MRFPVRVGLGGSGFAAVVPLWLPAARDEDILAELQGQLTEQLNQFHGTVKFSGQSEDNTHVPLRTGT